jgi:hypothetical protein
MTVGGLLIIAAVVTAVRRRDVDVAQKIAGVARVYRISPRFDHVDSLLGSGLDSAESISELGSDEFLQR